ncbi:hypothetical protein [Chryseobacterium turcicum]|uniref:Uncharacterized protein n=1 Tax=Chryseobacterium turcicum TaxID=2898076 RepID=A0A9Q3V5U0_9FLAO|nr:hypothetical protein [Chryseobacterium turcicum]MCD1117861.1 hypothetical protein [Chryseobacterium turcicum]
MKSKVIFFAFVLIIGCSKSQSSSPSISDVFIEKIALVEESLPSKYVVYNLYVKTDNSLILVTNVNFLNTLYNEHYKNRFKDFHSFLQMSLRQSFEINTEIAAKYKYQTFTVNPEIMKLSTKFIIEKYFQQTDIKEKYYFYSKGFSTSDMQTILYKMFLEGYMISFDDYGGKYNIIKFKDE